MSVKVRPKAAQSWPGIIACWRWLSFSRNAHPLHGDPWLRDEEAALPNLAVGLNQVPRLQRRHSDPDGDGRPSLIRLGARTGGKYGQPPPPAPPQLMNRIQ